MACFRLGPLPLPQVPNEMIYLNVDGVMMFSNDSLLDNVIVMTEGFLLS